MKVIIAGSRSIKKYEDVAKAIDHILSEHDLKVSEVVSGTAYGVDKLGEKYAEEHNIAIKQFPANWRKYGKSAGYKRNCEMAVYADACIVIWDGESKGSKHMIDIAKKEGLRLFVYNINNPFNNLH